MQSKAFTQHFKPLLILHAKFSDSLQHSSHCCSYSGLQGTIMTIPLGRQSHWLRTVAITQNPLARALTLTTVYVGSCYLQWFINKANSKNKLQWRDKQVRDLNNVADVIISINRSTLPLTISHADDWLTAKSKDVNSASCNLLLLFAIYLSRYKCWSKPRHFFLLRGFFQSPPPPPDMSDSEPYYPSYPPPSTFMAMVATTRPWLNIAPERDNCELIKNNTRHLEVKIIQTKHLQWIQSCNSWQHHFLLYPFTIFKA